MTTNQKEPSLTELKAAVYDRLATMERLQQETKAINQRIVELTKEAAEQKGKVTPIDGAKEQKA